MPLTPKQLDAYHTKAMDVPPGEMEEWILGNEIARQANGAVGEIAGFIPGGGYMHGAFGHDAIKDVVSKSQQEGGFIHKISQSEAL